MSGSPFDDKFRYTKSDAGTLNLKRAFMRQAQILSSDAGRDEAAAMEIAAKAAP
jgi:hypothetical protein